jgi:hypothetical protein
LPYAAGVPGRLALNRKATMLIVGMGIGFFVGVLLMYTVALFQVHKLQ